MPKIFILLACEECDHCKDVIDIHPEYKQYWWCVQSEKEIPDTGKIAEFCELDDAEEKDVNSM